ncbi:hypothetical protein EDD86DRAFT_192241 [Gorgonomyces haynaldii]|nr:hypothetical protein EDD86DRAFT_192241 [Gorgonomyces haynaldii]
MSAVFRLKSTLREYLEVKKQWPLYNLTLSTLTAVVIIALEGAVTFLVLRSINEIFTSQFSGSSSIIAIYFSMFIAALVFQLMVSVDAYYSNNSNQIVAISIFNFATVLYSIAQIYQTRALQNCQQELQTLINNRARINFVAEVYNLQQQAGCYFSLVEENPKNHTLSLVVNDATLNQLPSTIDKFASTFQVIFGLEYAVLVFMILFNAAGFFISWKVFKEYGWRNYEQQGASIEKRRMTFRYQTFIILLKLNLFFIVGTLGMYYTAVYFSDKGTDSSNNISIILPIMTVFGLAYYALGYFGARRASKPLLAVFCLTMLGCLILVCFVMYEAVTKNKYRSTKIWLTGFAALQVILTIITIMNALRLYQDIDNNLKDIFEPAPRVAQREDIE